MSRSACFSSGPRVFPKFARLCAREADRASGSACFFQSLETLPESPGNLRQRRRPDERVGSFFSKSRDFAGKSRELAPEKATGRESRLVFFKVSGLCRKASRTCAGEGDRTRESACFFQSLGTSPESLENLRQRSRLGERVGLFLPKSRDFVSGPEKRPRGSSRGLPPPQPSPAARMSANFEPLEGGGALSREAGEGWGGGGEACATESP